MKKKCWMPIFVFIIIHLAPVKTQTGSCRWPNSVYSDGVCFMLNTTRVTYDDAKAICISVGGALATANTMSQFNAISSLGNQYEPIWIGANDRAIEGEWRWEDSGALATQLTDYWDVEYGQPDDYPDADCGDIYIWSCFTGKLWDDDCNSTFQFACMDKSVTTTKATTTVTTQSTTLTTKTTTPTVSCSWPGSVYVDGGCFLLNTTLVTYDAAKTYCLSIGGVLATITTANQINVITLSSTIRLSYWIGANDIAVEGEWRWEDTGALATELTGVWDVYYRQPDNKNNDDCARIYLISCQYRKVWDEPCTSNVGFICMEKPLTTSPKATTTAAATSTTKTTQSSTSTSPLITSTTSTSIASTTLSTSTVTSLATTTPTPTTQSTTQISTTPTTTASTSATIIPVTILSTLTNTKPNTTSTTTLATPSTPLETTSTTTAATTTAATTTAATTTAATTTAATTTERTTTAATTNTTTITAASTTPTKTTTTTASTTTPTSKTSPSTSSLWYTFASTSMTTIKTSTTPITNFLTTNSDQSGTTANILIAISTTSKEQATTVETTSKTTSSSVVSNNTSMSTGAKMAATTPVSSTATKVQSCSGLLVTGLVSAYLCYVFVRISLSVYHRLI